MADTPLQPPKFGAKVDTNARALGAKEWAPLRIYSVVDRLRKPFR